MKQFVLPIKDTSVLYEAKDTLSHNFREGRRNYTIPQISEAVLLRVSDVLTLGRNKVYKTDGDIKKNAYIRDKKTGRPNILYLKPAK